jgi:hypothetical protein
MELSTAPGPPPAFLATFFGDFARFSGEGALFVFFLSLTSLFFKAFCFGENVSGFYLSDPEKFFSMTPLDFAGSASPLSCARLF